MKKILSLLVVAMLTLSLLAGCGSSGTTGGSTDATDTAATGDATTTTDTTDEGQYCPDTTVLSMSTWIGYAPLHVALEKGFFAENGVEVEIAVIESAGDQRSALASGQIQGAATTIDTTVMSQSIGIDAIQILALDYSNGGDGVVAKNEYNSLADLKGKTVAIDTTGGASLFWFNYMLKDLGMTMDDFEIVNMGAGDAGTSFVAGQVEAAVTWEPWLTNAQNTDFGKVLLSSADYPGVIVDTLSMSKEYVDAYPDSVKGIVSAWYEALAYIETNPDDANQIMADAMGMPLEDFLATWSAVYFYDQAGNIAYFDTQIADMCQSVSDIWIELGLMENPVAPADSFDGSFLQ